MSYKSINVVIIPVLLFFIVMDGPAQKISNSSGLNILLINIDDLGWQDLGFIGSNYYETPNIDKLASRGMVFSRGYAAAANCAPSRAALMSGMYAPRTGVYTVNNADRGESIHRKLIPTPNTEHLADSVLTLAEVLQQNGYRTMHAGKWHLGETPSTQGFDVNIAGAEYGHPASYFSPYKNRALKDGPEGEYLNDRIATEAIDALNSVDEQPFFLYFSPYIVHTPIQPKEELKEKYEQKPARGIHDNPGYAAMVETMDHNVGRLIQNLKETGRLSNTFIIFTSDNGGLYRVSKQHPLRAGKGTYYEGGIRVPLMFIWPGHIAEQSIADVPVSNVDLYPTILDVAEISKPKDKLLDGVSLWPVLQGGELEERSLYWHFPIYLQAYKYGENQDLPDPYFRTRPGSVIMKGSWKLHEYFEDNRLELYNLDTDIGERKNLKDVCPEIVEMMHQELLNWRHLTNAPVPKQLNPEYKK